MKYSLNYLPTKHHTYLSRVIPKTPIIFQNNNTPVVNILADPLKKTLFYGIFIITLYITLATCNIINYKLIYSLFIFVFLVYIYVSQMNTNNSVLYTLAYLPRHPNVYEYEKLKNYDNSITILITVVLLYIIISSIMKQSLNDLNNTFY